MLTEKKKFYKTKKLTSKINRVKYSGQINKVLMKAG